MKKLLVIIFTIVLAASMLTGCGVLKKIVNSNIDNSTTSAAEEDDSDKDKDKDKSNSGFKYDDPVNYIKEHLTGDYSLTYLVTVNAPEETKEFNYIQMRTEEGYFLNYMDQDVLFIKNGDMYDCYYRNVSKGYEKADFLEQMTEEEVEKMLWSRTQANIIHKHDMLVMSNYDAKGEDTIAGRKCDKFTENKVAVGAASGCSVWIDQETGVCMKYDYGVAIKGVIGEVIFECTEFKTGDVKLPEHN